MLTANFGAILYVCCRYNVVVGFEAKDSNANVNESELQQYSDCLGACFYFMTTLMEEC